MFDLEVYKTEIKINSNILAQKVENFFDLPPNTCTVKVNFNYSNSELIEWKEIHIKNKTVKELEEYSNQLKSIDLNVIGPESFFQQDKRLQAESRGWVWASYIDLRSSLIDAIQKIDLALQKKLSSSITMKV